MNYLIRFFSLRHAWKHKVRSILTLAGVALGVALVIAIHTVNHSILESFRRMLDSIAGRATLQVSAGPTGVPENLWEGIEKLSNVRYVTPVVQQILRIPDFNHETVLVLGIDFTGDEHFRDYRYSDEEGTVDDPLAFLNDPDAVLISESFAKKYLKKVGDRFDIQSPSGKKSLRIRGLLKADGPARAFGGNFMVMDIFAAQALFLREGRFDRFDLITSDTVPVRDVMEQLKTSLGNEYKVEIPRARGDSAQTLLASFQTGLTMGGFVALMVALFLIYNTMQISVTQRRKEISIAKAIGAKRSDIIKLFIGESLLLGVIASALGIVIGLWMAKGLLATVSGAVSMHFLKVNPESIYIAPWILVAGFFAGVASSAIAALGPARLAASVSPVEGLRFEATESAFRPSWTTINAKIAYALAVSTAILWICSFRFTNILWGYGTQLFSILTFAFLAPTLMVFTWRFLRPIPQRFFKPPEWLAFDLLPRQAARTAVTLSAIMIGFGMVVEIDNYIFSMKRTIQRFVEQSIPADLFVMSGAKLARMDNRPMPKDLESLFLSWPEVEAIDKVRITDIEFGDTTVPLLSNVPEVYLPRVKRDFVQGALKEALERLPREPVAIVAENFLRRFGKKVGDSISISTPNGPKPFQIIGSIEDYTSDRGLIAISRNQFVSIFGDDLVDSFDIYLKDKSTLETIRRRILDGPGKTYELFALTNEEMKTEIFKIIDETYKVIKVMELVAVLVAVLGIVNTILASVLERTRMLGVLRALGATKRQVARLVIAEGAYLALGGIALGFILGVVLTQIIFSTILPNGTGWVFQVQIPYWRILGVAALGFVLSGLAAYLPARMASNLNVVKAIQYD